MATKTSLRVSLLVLLVVLYLDCSLQGAQASPTGNILPTWAEKRLDVPEGHLAVKTVTVFKGNSTGDPGAVTVDLVYSGRLPPLKGATTSNTVAVTYPANVIVAGITVKTNWNNGVGTLVLTGIGPNNWALTWGLPPDGEVLYDVIVTVITP
jgi:hypothetical protein